MGANFAKRPEYKRSSTQSGNFSTVSLSAQLVTDLSSAPAYSFANWPNPSVPTFGAGVYTIWNNDGRFIYVGMSGVGRVYQQTFIDTYAVARPLPSQAPGAARPSHQSGSAAITPLQPASAG